MVDHHLSGDVYSSEQLIAELHTYFHVNEEAVVPVQKQNVPVKADIQKKKPFQKMKSMQIPDESISQDLQNELKQLREQHLHASKLSPSVYASAVKKKSN